MSAEKLDFDPNQMGRDLVRWLESRPEPERLRARNEFSRRAEAATHVLRAVNSLRTALELAQDSRLPQAVRELLQVARDLNDYDPTSD